MATRNDVTGHSIKSRGQNKAYSDGWDRAFGNNKEEEQANDEASEELEELITADLTTAKIDGSKFVSNDLFINTNDHNIATIQGGISDSVVGVPLIRADELTDKLNSMKIDREGESDSERSYLDGWNAAIRILIDEYSDGTGREL